MAQKRKVGAWRHDVICAVLWTAIDELRISNYHLHLPGQGQIGLKLTSTPEKERIKIDLNRSRLHKLFMRLPALNEFFRLWIDKQKKNVQSYHLVSWAKAKRLHLRFDQVEFCLKMFQFQDSKKAFDSLRWNTLKGFSNGILIMSPFSLQSQQAI